MDKDNPLEFFVAYQIGTDEKLRYLGDGKGGLRLFKTLEGLDTFLDGALSPEQRAKTFTHTIQGQIAVPEIESKHGTVIPITSLAPDMFPTAQELLRDHELRRLGKHHSKGK